VGIEFADDGGGHKMTRASRWNGHSREGGNADPASHIFGTTLGCNPYFIRANTSFMLFIDIMYKTGLCPYEMVVSALSCTSFYRIPAATGMTK
jgi:hypothetical protein